MRLLVASSLLLLLGAPAGAGALDPPAPAFEPLPTPAPPLFADLNTPALYLPLDGSLAYVSEETALRVVARAAQFQDGVAGQALQLTASNTVSLPSLGSLEMYTGSAEAEGSLEAYTGVEVEGHGFTISAWLKVDVWGMGQTAISASGNNPQGDIHIATGLHINTLSFRYNVWTSAAAYSNSWVAVHCPVELGAWVHVAMSINESLVDTAFTAFVNGSVCGSYSNRVAGFVHGWPRLIKALTLGANLDSSGRKFVGGVDEVRLYTHAVDAEEVQLLLAAGPLSGAAPSAAPAPAPAPSAGLPASDSTAFPDLSAPALYLPLRDAAEVYLVSDDSLPMDSVNVSLVGEPQYYTADGEGGQDALAFGPDARWSLSIVMGASLGLATGNVTSAANSHGVTFSAWLYIPGSSDWEAQTAISASGFNAQGDIHIGPGVRDSTLSFRYNVFTGESTDVWTATHCDIVRGQWNHVALSIMEAPKFTTFTGFVAGSACSVYASKHGYGKPRAITNITLGANLDSSKGAFTGGISNFRVYAHPMGITDVTALLTAPPITVGGVVF